MYTHALGCWTWNKPVDRSELVGITLHTANMMAVNDNLTLICSPHHICKYRSRPLYHKTLTIYNTKIRFTLKVQHQLAAAPSFQRLNFYHRIYFSGKFHGRNESRGESQTKLMAYTLDLTPKQHYLASGNPTKS